jgi:hypothetical protein
VAGSSRRLAIVPFARPVTIVIFFLGIFAGIASAVLRRSGKAPIILAGGAAVLVIVAFAGLLHQDMREGLAAVESNRREYLFVLASETPVLLLALFSMRWLKRLLFWLGWGIHAAFTGCVVTVVIWLKYFWHW